HPRDPRSFPTRRSSDLQKVAELDKEVAELSQQVGGVEVERHEEATERLKPHVGLTPVRGPGLTVTLDDAPREMRDGQLNLDALVDRKSTRLNSSHVKIS